MPGVRRWSHSSGSGVGACHSHSDTQGVYQRPPVGPISSVPITPSLLLLTSVWMKRWTCSRANSSNRSHVLLTFGFGVVDFEFSMTCPPALPRLQPGGLYHPRGYAARLWFPHFLKLPRISKNSAQRQEEKLGKRTPTLAGRPFPLSVGAILPFIFFRAYFRSLSQLVYLQTVLHTH